MRERLWRALARLLARPAVAAWLIDRAKRTPYSHIVKRTADGKVAMYMERYWLFNPYPVWGVPRRFEWLRKRLPSVRIHGIHLPDQDRDKHSHPWYARTILLLNSYIEERLLFSWKGPNGEWVGDVDQTRTLKAGDTAALKPDDYHRITDLPEGPVYTLFITWEYMAKWGFRVNGKHVYYKDYLGIDK